MPRAAGHARPGGTAAPVESNVNREERAELIERWRRTPDRVAELIAAFPLAALGRRPSPEAFSAREHVHHLRDIEVDGFAVRLRRLLEEEAPHLPDLDGARLARERRYNEHPHEAALAELRRVRASCAAELERLGDADWRRSGTLETVGVVTVERLVELWWNHDRGHLDELEVLASSPTGGEESSWI